MCFMVGCSIKQFSLLFFPALLASRILRGYFFFLGFLSHHARRTKRKGTTHSLCLLRLAQLLILVTLSLSLAKWGGELEVKAPASSVNTMRYHSYRFETILSHRRTVKVMET